MEDPFKDDSPSRKYARLRYWRRLLSLSGPRKGGKHLLFTKTGPRDLVFLQGMHMRLKNVFVVIEDPEQALLVQDQFPEVTVLCSSLEEAAKEFHRELETATLDFAETLSDELLERARRFYSTCLVTDGIFGMTFRGGQEVGQIRLRIDAAKLRYQTFDPQAADNKKILTKYFADKEWMFGAPPGDAEFYASLADVELGAFADSWRTMLLSIQKHAPVVEGFIRLMAVTRQLCLEGFAARTEIIPTDFMTHSEDGELSSSLLAHIYRGSPGMTLKKFTAKFASEALRRAPAAIIGCDYTEESFKEYTIQCVELMQADVVAKILNIDDKLPIAELFGVSEETVDQWKKQALQVPKPEAKPK